MDDPRSTRNNVIFIVVVIVLVGVAAMYVFTGQNEESTTIADEYAAVLEDVKQIQELKIVGGILDHAGFKALVDFSVPVSPTTPPGRANPFLSL